MGIHKWRKRKSEHFGELWVPFAQIDLCGSDHEFHSFVLQIDSGAVVSVLRPSIAGLLGIKLEEGRHLELTSVGGAKTIAFLHEIRAKFAENIILIVPFAIAEKETVPNLLGRLGVFDRLQIDFDATLQQTRIHPTWTDPDGVRIWNFLNETEDHILSRFGDFEATKDCKAVIRGFIHRAAQIAASGFAMLQEQLCYAGPLLIRSVFELSLQFEYLLLDPESRSQQYAAFSHITKHEMVQAIIRDPKGFVGKALASSPLRQEGEKRNMAEYQRVLPMFLNKKGATWAKWYKDTTYGLAKTLKREAEYRVIYAQTSAWSHGDPSSTMAYQIDFLAQPEPFWITLLGFYCRMLLSLAEAFKIILSKEQFEVLKQMSKDRS